MVYASDSRKSWFEKLKKGLSKSRTTLGSQLANLFVSHKAVDEALWEDIESVLIQADVGVNATLKIVDKLRSRVRKEQVREPEIIREWLREELVSILKVKEVDLAEDKKPLVYLIVGVNGSGKTTTIAKMAHKFLAQSKKVLLVAADTFRAAAIEQLDIWADQLGIKVIKHKRGSDPAAVVFDAIQAAKARDIDVVLVDTAGRLHTYVNLMEELRKIKRVAVRESQDGQVITFLVIDATTGQNGIAQAKLFNEALSLDGIVLAKLDGTAKGGIVVAIQEELGIPVRLVGLGEKLDDLQKFNPEVFVEALIST
jgi:fused signal recognition particle receptor